MTGIQLLFNSNELLNRKCSILPLIMVVQPFRSPIQLHQRNTLTLLLFNQAFAFIVQYPPQSPCDPSVHLMKMKMNHLLLIIFNKVEVNKFIK